MRKFKLLFLLVSTSFAAQHVLSEFEQQQELKKSITAQNEIEKQISDAITITRFLAAPLRKIIFEYASELRCMRQKNLDPSCQYDSTGRINSVVNALDSSGYPIFVFATHATDVAGYDTLQVWDTKNDRWSSMIGHRYEAESVCLVKNRQGGLCAISCGWGDSWNTSWNSLIKIWDLNTGKCRKTIINEKNCSQKPLTFIAHAQDNLGQDLIIAGKWTYKIWNMASGQLTKSFEPDLRIIKELLILDDNKKNQLAILRGQLNPEQIKYAIYDVLTGEIKSSFVVNNEFSLLDAHGKNQDGQLIIISAKENRVIMVNLELRIGEEIEQLDSIITAVSYYDAMDKKLILAIDLYGNLVVWDLVTKMRQCLWQTDEKNITRAILTTAKSGELVAITITKNLLKMWSINSGSCLYSIDPGYEKDLKPWRNRDGKESKTIVCKDNRGNIIILTASLLSVVKLWRITSDFEIALQEQIDFDEHLDYLQIMPKRVQVIVIDYLEPQKGRCAVM